MFPIQLTDKNERYPEATVGAIIVNNSGDIFLMKSDKWKGMYCLPGGHIEVGESISDALRREIKEETNLDISTIQFHSIQDCIFSEYYHEQKHFIFIDFVCKAISETVKLNEEGTEYIWANPHNIEELPVEPYTLKTIALYNKVKIVNEPLDRYI
jgi:nucleoside triphosphatase